MLELFSDFSLFAVKSMEANDFCKGLGNVVIILANVIKLLQWGIALGLIFFGLLDLGKAVIAGKEDEMKKAQGTLIKRVIYAVAVFLVVTIVWFIMGMVGNTEWRDCWNEHVGNSNGGINNIEGE